MQFRLLAEFYLDSRDFRRLAINSQIFYQRMISTTYNYVTASTDVEGIDAQYADRLYGKIEKSQGVHRAISVCKVLRKVWNVGKRHGLIKANPFEQMGLQASVPPREQLWAPDQIKTFCATSLAEKRPGLATLVALCYYLAQRPGDMSKLELANFGPFLGDVEFVQEKTNKLLNIQVPQVLVSILLAYFHGLRMSPYLNTSYVVVVDHTGNPYNRAALNKEFARIRDLAKLPKELQLRDLRRTALTEMAENGATDAEMQAVGGHADPAILHKVYIKNTLALSASGMSKRFPQLANVS